MQSYSKNKKRAKAGLTQIFFVKPQMVDPHSVGVLLLFFDSRSESKSDLAR